jgi:hypothetical protein
VVLKSVANVIVLVSVLKLAALIGRPAQVPTNLPLYPLAAATSNSE